MATHLETASLNLPTLSWRNYAVPTLVGGPTNLGRPPVVISVFDIADGVVTITCDAAPHRLREGDFVRLRVEFGAAGSEIYQAIIHSKIWRVAADISPLEFSVLMPETAGMVVILDAGSLPGGMAASFMVKCMAQRAILRADGNVTVGPDAAVDWKALAAGGEVTLEAPTGAKFDLADWFVSDGVGLQIDVLYV